MKLRNVMWNASSTLMKNQDYQPMASPFKMVYIGLLAFILLPGANLFAQCELACKQYHPIVLDTAGQVTITPPDVLNNYPDPDCPGTIAISLTTMAGVPVSNDIDCALAGDTIMVTATHLGSGNSCWGSIVIIDDFAPLLTCQDLFVFCSDSLLVDSVGYPGWMENCTVLENDDFYYTDVYQALPCSTIVNGQVITGSVARTWGVEDASGNVGTCQQTIYLKTAGVSDITFPIDLDGFAAPALNCDANVKDLKITGQPTVDGFPIYTLGFCDFVVDTFDETSTACQSGGYRTLRTWRIIDFCQDTTIYHTQVIIRQDSQAPILAAPADITVSTSSVTCDALVNLPTSWTATDDCSSYAVTVSWPFGSGYGPFQKVPKGIHSAIYRAEDACGNVALDTMQVTVIDDKKPTAVCKKDVNIALPSSGIITVPASLFDDGSYDNCNLSHLEVSRDNGPFGSHATFNCADIPTNVMVILKAVDVEGLTNTCMMIVLIQDKLAPAIDCPDDITVTCQTDIKKLNITGSAIGTDNCQMKSVVYTDTKFLNACQEGYVNRLWTAEDIYGNKSGCLQVITQVDTTPIQIIWPVNFASDQCGQDVDPTVTGEPQISGKDCENLFVLYDDKIFKTAYPACYRIERCWTIKEWCKYNPNQTPNPGEWTHVQYIDVYDNEAPVLNVPADVTIGAQQLNCQGEVLIQPATAEDCNPAVVITNNSPYALSPGASVNGFYPVGVHEVMFTAWDGCGNNAMATMRITVIDDKAPLAVCNQGVTVGLNMDGIALLPTQLIDNNSSDNCTPNQQLALTLTPNMFDCDSLGSRIVKLTVTDLKGNTNFCTTTVVIQDNLGICTGTKSELGGQIMTMTGNNMAGVEVWINGIDVLQTNTEGTYYMENLQEGMNYTLTPELEDNPAKGLSVADIIAMQKHILGKAPMTSSYALIAGDVNFSGSITITDILEIRKILLGMKPGFTNAPVWTFVDASYSFKNGSKPTAEPFPQSILIEEIEGSWMNNNFVAIKTGDVTGNATFTGSVEAETRSDVMATLNIRDQYVNAGETYRIALEIDSESELIGMQWELHNQSAAIRFKRFENGGWTSLQSDMVNVYEEGVKTVWHSFETDPETKRNPLMYLEIIPEESGWLSEMLQLGQALSPEVIDHQGFEGKLELVFYKGDIVSKAAGVNTIWPNPFRNEINIGLTLEEAGEVTFMLVDVLGRHVWESQAEYEAGEHEIQFSFSDLGRSGMYQLVTLLPDGKPIQNTLIRLDE